jgi:hypothetical protein
MARLFLVLIALSFAVPAQAEINLLKEALKPIVRVLDRDITVYHWTSRSGLGLPETGPFTVKPENILGYARGVAHNFEGEDNSGSAAGPGLYAALDPVVTQGYGGAHWALLAISLVKGTRYLDFHFTTQFPASHSLDTYLETHGCQKEMEAGVWQGEWDSLLNTNLPECRKLVTETFHELQIGMTFYNYDASDLDLCTDQLGAALVIQAPEAIRNDGIKLFTADTPDVDGGAESKHLISAFFQHISQRSLSPAEQETEPSPRPEPIQSPNRVAQPDPSSTPHPLATSTPTPTSTPSPTSTHYASDSTYYSWLTQARTPISPSEEAWIREHTFGCGNHESDFSDFSLHAFRRRYRAIRARAQADSVAFGLQDHLRPERFSGVVTRELFNPETARSVLQSPFSKGVLDHLTQPDPADFFTQWKSLRFSEIPNAALRSSGTTPNEVLKWFEQLSKRTASAREPVSSTFSNLLWAAATEHQLHIFKNERTFRRMTMILSSRYFLYTSPYNENAEELSLLLLNYYADRAELPPILTSKNHAFQKFWGSQTGYEREQAALYLEILQSMDESLQLMSQCLDWWEAGRPADQSLERACAIVSPD